MNITHYWTIACLLFISTARTEIKQLYCNDSSETFIIRWAFQDLCDHFFDPYCTNDLWPTCESSGGASFNPEDVQSGDIVFVRNMDLFMKDLHPTIKNPYIIITHGEHHDTTHEHQLSYLSEKNIIAWFTIHPFKEPHSKYFALPLGIQQFKNWYANKIEFNAYLKNLRETTPKSNTLYLNFNPETHSDRKKLYDMFCNESFCVTRTNNISYEEYLKDMAQCKFALAPRGLGPDTYRAWESLLVGTIPIVQRGMYEESSFFETPAHAPHSALDDLYEGLPVLIIDDWEQLSLEFLNKKYEEIVAKKYDISPLYLDYWKQKIENVREGYFQAHPSKRIQKKSRSKHKRKKLKTADELAHWSPENGSFFRNSDIDVTIISPIKWADGIGRIPIGFVDVLKNELAINHKKMSIGEYDFTDVPQEIETIIKSPDKTPGNVGFFCSGLWYTFADLYKEVPEECFIKVAYSMLESSAIPVEWVKILNEKFDLVAVPDDYYKKVYSKCGVTIPIVVLPHGVYLDALLKEPLKEDPSSVFTFGLTAVYSTRKNQKLLVKAFLAEFCNEPGVKLKLHGRWGDDTYLKKLLKKISKRGAHNVEWSQEILSDEGCTNFLKSIDCYALLSKGEGYSVTPREALALGIPCILSNNTAHKSICHQGIVYPVASSIKEAADYGDGFGNQVCGNYYNCSVEEARKALRKVYTDYKHYKKIAAQGREWAAQFTWQRLKNRFKNIIKPQKVILGYQDMVTDDYLMTTSKALYDKFNLLIAHSS